MNALEVKNLKVKFGKEEIIQGITFEIPEGTITALVGPNGAGKSTLFKAILGLIPYEGEIKIFGKNHLSGLDLIGYFPQYFKLDESLPLTVYEFLRLSCSDQEKINKILKELKMDFYKNHPFSILSGGQKEKIFFARSVVNHPKLVLLDEPINDSDPAGAQKIYEIIKKLNKEYKMTFIIITHEISIIHNFAQRVLCLNRKLICNGPIFEFFKEEVLKELYGFDVLLHPTDEYLKHEFE